MWIPKDAQEVEAAAREGRLEETASFDAKRELPTAAKKNVDLATDVAAMATDGGVLLYGIAEDEDERPTVPTPISLAGAGERVGQIVSTSIAEVPHIELRELPTSNDASRGYLVVIVPQSPRAPHQVTVGGDLRFYGRGPKGNRRLTEGDVARLYERRQRWAIDAETILAEVVAAAPMPPDDDLGFFHAFAYPVVRDQDMWDRAEAAFDEGRLELQQAMMKAINALKITGAYSPTLQRLPQWFRQGADAWRMSTYHEGDLEERRPDRLAEIVVSIDGRARTFNGRAVPPLPSSEGRVIFEGLIAGSMASLLAAVNVLYDAASYLGPVDIGVAVTNLKGAFSVQSHDRFGFMSARPYNAETFTRTLRVSAASLEHPEDRTRELMGRFFEATTGIDDFDPFTM